MLERLTTIPDLGTLLNSKLIFNDHYLAVIDKANGMLGFITRNMSDFKGPVCMKVIYCSLVRSILEFNSVSWAILELFGSID